MRSGTTSPRLESVTATHSHETRAASTGPRTSSARQIRSTMVLSSNLLMGRLYGSSPAPPVTYVTT